MTDQHKTINIAILAYPGVQMAAVFGLSDLFLIANKNSDRNNSPDFNYFEVQDIEKSPADIQAIIIPPNLTGSYGENETEIHHWLNTHHASGTIMCSVCAGAFWLGHSGLLKKRPATTHWILEDQFRETFPDTELHAEHILIDDNDIVTAGGLMAWLDMGLYLTRRFLGPHAMSETARHLLVDPSGREQKNYRSFRPSLTHGNTVILKLQHWLEANIGSELTVNRLSEQTNMSERTFLRHFKQATGLPPNTYIQNLRIEKARGLLERTRLSINEIGYKVGYTDPSAFSRLFKQTTGLNAGEYRKRFAVNV